MRGFVRRLTRRMHKALTAPATLPWPPNVRDYPRKDGSGLNSVARCLTR